ncbi:MAG: Splicing factor [Pycnora praestabilis]|nr:MAG: Splicing factor [Pycnora praestabilis]
MDISSLLSPQESPVDENPPPVRGPAGKRRRERSDSQTPTITSSPHVGAIRPPPVLPHNAVAQAQQMMPSPPIISPNTGLVGSATSTPSADGRPAHPRQPSTPGMDTLADLASMQHHQQTTRANAGGLRSAEVFDTQLSPSMYPNLHTVPRTLAAARSTLDMTTGDAPAQTTFPRTFTATSLSENDLKTIAHLVGYLAENPYAHESHVQLIKLLHRGFVSHIHPPSASSSQGDPHTYDLLKDLRQAREAMDARFPVCEDLWVDWISDESILARTIEERIAVMELCQRAVAEEIGSTVLWLRYGEWMWSLYTAVYEKEIMSANGTTSIAADAVWSVEDKLLGKEVFSWETMIDVWEQGVNATEDRINDSHLFWDRYTEILIQGLAAAPTREGISHIKALFISRLQVPHATWEQTFQKFSTFVSTYDNAMYEDTMVDANRRGAEARRRFGSREMFELRLQRALDSPDKDAEWTTYSEYLEWELSHQGHGRKKGAIAFNLPLCNALYERAVIRFPTDSKLWEDYVILVVDKAFNKGPYAFSPLPVLERATRHCPWSGSLWSQYLLTTEKEHKPFHDIEDVKHRATSTGLLDVGGMEEILKVTTAWCGFLRRRAFDTDATDEELDVAEVGIRSALESVRTLGEKKYGKEYKGDPHYRIERIYIKYLSQSGMWDSARDAWQGLISLRGDSYEFWLQYYQWEMITWGRQTEGHIALAATNEKKTSTPRHATAVLKQATKRTNLDWPEKIMETLIHHCEDHEEVEELQLTTIEVKKATESVKRRRENEAVEAAAVAQQQYDAQDVVPPSEAALNSIKRKREFEADSPEEIANKKSRSDEQFGEVSQNEDQPIAHDSLLKRDRENTTVTVRNLPVNATETRVRQYFRDCGTINSLKVLPEHDGFSATATIEFESKEDILSAQTRDSKSFEGNLIEIEIGTGSTLYVTNFPKTADERYIRDRFEEFGEIVDIRWPSLKYATHRRFCYVQYTSSSQARAATVLDGKSLEDNLTLSAKISNPGQRQDRTGAIHEGREVYCSNVDWTATEEELTKIFEKYGKVEKVRIPTNVAGKSKGIAFIVFSSKDEASAALDMHLTKFKSRLLNVTLATANPAKRQATTVITSRTRSSTSPSPDTQVTDGTEQPLATSSSVTKPTFKEIQERTIALMNIPDTINDTRIRGLLEPYGPLKKIVMRHDHQGAIVEFTEISSAGKAALGMDGHEILPGRKLAVGTVAQMLKQGDEKRTDRITVGKKEVKADIQTKSSSFQPSAAIRRPNQPGARRGGRGGLGIKHGGVGLGGPRANDAAPGGKEAETNGAEPGKQEGKKSNADFRAMITK